MGAVPAMIDVAGLPAVIAVATTLRYMVEFEWLYTTTALPALSSDTAG